MPQGPKIAIIGAGRWGKKLIETFSSVSPEVTVAICAHSGSETSATWLKEHYPAITVTKNVEDVFSDLSIDAVVLATPINTHFDLASLAIASGKHVFIEKPITERLEEAEKLVELSKTFGKIVFVGFVFIYHDVLRYMRENVDLSPFTSVSFVWEKYGTFTEDIQLNLLTHEISIMYELFGTPVKAAITEEKGVESKTDILDITYSFEGGRTSTVHLNRVSKEKKKIITLTSPERELVWQDDTLCSKMAGTAERTIIYTAEMPALERECRAFVSCIKDGRSAETDALFGLAVLKILSLTKPL